VKQLCQLVLILSVLAFVGCGGKKNVAATNTISSQYKLTPFEDVNNPSTVNYEELKDLPAVVDLKDQMTSVKDQYDRGTCTFFTVVSLIEAAVKKKMNVEVNFSEEYYNYVMKTAGSYKAMEGGTSYANFKIMNRDKKGFLLERDWPYQPSWFGLKEPCGKFDLPDSSAPAECFSHNSPPAHVLAKVIPSENFNLRMLYPETTNEIIREMAVMKQPMEIGLSVNYDGWPDNGEVQYTEEMRQKCISQEVSCGGHSIVLTGYDLNKKIFFFKNSWSSKWGNGGYGTIPIDVIDRHVDFIIAMASLEKDIVLPVDMNVKNYKVQKLKINSAVASDGSVKVESSAEVDVSGVYTLFLDTKLFQKKSIFANSLATDDNMILYVPNEKEQEEYGSYGPRYTIIVFPNKDKAITKWEEGADYHMVLNPKVMKIPSLVELNRLNDERLLLKTSLNVFTDEGRKVLKSYYHPMNYKN
jgi:hypothetical protein